MTTNGQLLKNNFLLALTFEGNFDKGTVIFSLLLKFDILIESNGSNL